MLLPALLSLILSEPPEIDARIAELTASAEAHRDAEEYAAAASDYLTLASLPRADAETALKKAHLNLDAAFVKTGEAAHLCRALAVGRRRVAAKHFKTDQARLSWEETVADDEKRLAEVGGEEQCPAAVDPRHQVLLDANVENPKREEPAGPIPAQIEPAKPRYIDVSRERKVRARTVAGATLTGMGLGFAGLMGLTLAVHAQQTAALRRANDVPDSYTYSEKDAKTLTGLHDDAQLTQAASIGLGISSAVVLATGIGLLASRHRAPRAMAIAPHGGLHGGGLTLRLRF